MKRMFLDTVKTVERLIIAALVVMMMLVLVFSAVDLGWMLVRDLFFHEPMFLLSVNDLLDLFGLFMLVLIGIELLDTVLRTYLAQRSSHVEVVLSVAIIAIARKIIVMDVKDQSPLTLVGIASVTFGLCAGYYLLRNARLRNKVNHGDESGRDRES